MRRRRLAGLRQRLLHAGGDLVHHRLRLLGAEDAAADECRRVARPRARMLLDDAVHERLGVRGVVALVVAQQAIADEVDDDVLVERGTVGHRHPGAGDDGFGIVGIHVQDRCVDHLRDVGRVVRRSTRLRRRGESELVVDDEVHRSTGAVALDERQVERLGDDALARHRRVAMDEGCKEARPLFVPGAELFLDGARAIPSTTGLTASRWEGLDAITTGNVAPERPTQVPTRRPCGARASPRNPATVSGVKWCLQSRRSISAYGLPTMFASVFQPPAVRTGAEHGLDNAGSRRLFEQRVEEHDCGLATFETEAALPDVANVEELLEHLRRRQLVQRRPRRPRRAGGDRRLRDAARRTLAHSRPAGA